MEICQKQHNSHHMGENRSYSVEPTRSVPDTESILQTVQIMNRVFLFLVAFLSFWIHLIVIDIFPHIAAHYVDEMKEDPQ